MKKLAILLALFLYGSQGWAQKNYNFCCEPGPHVSTGPTFTGTDNWKVSHGTPNWVFHSIFMWHLKSATPAGEGIYQDNVFPTTGRYRVRIGISYITSDCKLHVYATSGLSPGAFLSMPVPVPTLLKDSISSYTGTATEWDFEFTNTSGYHQIWIWPEQISSRPGIQAECSIDYVRVCDYGKGMTYSSGIIPDADRKRDFFNIGSSFPSGSGVVVNNTGSSNTYIAGSFIDIRNNTYLSPGSGIFFEGRIEPGCSRIEDCGDTSGCPSYATARLMPVSEEQVRIYPNPGSGTFNIATPVSEGYDLQVTDAIGTTVYRSRIPGGGTQRISLPDVAPGNYLVLISNEQFRYVSKLVIVK